MERNRTERFISLKWDEDEEEEEEALHIYLFNGAHKHKHKNNLPLIDIPAWETFELKVQPQL